MITDEEIRITAELSGIRLSPDDFQALRIALQNTLLHFEAIAGIDSDDIHGHPVERIISLSETRQDLSLQKNPELLFKNAPDFEDGFFFVPRIVK